MILLLLACSGAPAPPGPAPHGPATLEGSLASCAPYRALPDAFGHCVAQRAAQLRTRAEVEALCPHAGTWAGDCRQDWVAEQERRHTHVPQAELLLACGDNSDCAFQLLERAPEGDVLAQIGQCERFVPRYLADCVAHSLQRWVNTQRPGPTEAARVAAGAPAHAYAIGAALGKAEACLKTLTCPPTEDDLGSVCRRTSGEFQAHPERCRAR